MKDADKIIDSIYSKKNDIAVAIFLAFYDGKYNYKNIDFLSHIIKSIEESKIIIINDNFIPDTSDDETEISELLGKISDFLGYDVSSVFYNPSLKIESNFTKSIELKQEETKLYFLYLTLVNMFLKLGVSYEDFFNRYKKGENVLELTKLVKVLHRKYLFFYTKKNISDITNMISINNNITKISNIIEAYHLTSIEDITNLYAEVSIALRNGPVLDEEGKNIVELNRAKVEERYGSRLNKLKLIKLKHELDRFYDVTLFKSFVYSSNMKESLKKHNISLNKDMFPVTFNMYKSALTNRPFNANRMIGEDRYNFVVFPRSFFKFSESQIELAILHELIHAAEPKDNVQKSVSHNYNSLNEALTQYLSREAYGYYKISELDIETIIENINKDACSYNCMLPLVDILKNSDLWEYVLEMKIKNDFSVLESKIGKHANEIFNVFDSIYTKKENNEISLEIIKEHEEELIRIIKNTLSDLNRCNKNY